MYLKFGCNAGRDVDRVHLDTRKLSDVYKLAFANVQVSLIWLATSLYLDDSKLKGVVFSLALLCKLPLSHPLLRDSIVGGIPSVHFSFDSGCCQALLLLLLLFYNVLIFNSLEPCVGVDFLLNLVVSDHHPIVQVLGFF